MKLVTVVAGLFVALLGREAWGWLPRLSGLVLRVETSIVPSERREVRLREWQAELTVFGDRRLSGLLWTVQLLPVCVWEASKAERVEFVVTYVVNGGAFLFAYSSYFLYPAALVTAAFEPFGLSPVQSVAFVLLGPVVFCYLYMWIVGVFGLIWFCFRGAVGSLSAD